MVNCAVRWQALDKPGLTHTGGALSTYFSISAFLAFDIWLYLMVLDFKMFVLFI